MSLMIKYRPQTFDDVIGQGVVAEVLRNQSRYDALRGLYILTGHFGGGKTTLARLIMKAANCEDKDERGNPCGVCGGCQGNPMDMMEVDAGQTSGVDDIRKIIEWTAVRPIGKKKVLVIDEVHLLSRQAVSALLKTLEEPPEYLVIVLCTTEEDAIPATIMSRSAQRFALGAVPEEVLKAHILKIAGLEGIRITDGAAALLAKRSEGAVRNALGLLEQVNVSEEVTEDTVQAVLGAAHDAVTFHMLQAVITSDIRGALDTLEEADGFGIELGTFVKDVERANADCVKAAFKCPVTGTEGYVREVNNILSRHDLEALINAAAVIQKLKLEMRQAATKEAFITTFAACNAEPEKAVMKRADALEKRIEALEKCRAAAPVPVHEDCSAPEEPVYEDVPDDYYDQNIQEYDVQEPAPEPVSTPPAVSAVTAQDDGFQPAGEADGVPFDEDPPAAVAAPAAAATEPKEEPAAVSQAEPEVPAPAAPPKPAVDPFAMMMRMVSKPVPAMSPAQGSGSAAAVQTKPAPAAVASAPKVTRAMPVNAAASSVQKPEGAVNAVNAAAEAQKQMIEKSAEARRKLEEALCQDLDLYRAVEGKFRCRSGGGKLKVVLSEPGLVGRMMYLVTTFGLGNEVEVMAG